MDYKVKTGDLDKRIIIQKDATYTDESGFPVEKWDTYKPVWASMNNLYGAEFYSAMAVQEENTVSFTVRYSKDLEVLLEENGSKTYRIFWNKKSFNITFCDNIKYQNLWIKIKAMVI